MSGETLEHTPVYKTIRPSRLYEQIVEQIEAAVAEGNLKPGDQLPPERELGAKFGVSRTAVREALRALHEKGLVEAHPGRGTFITSASSQGVLQSLGWMTKISQAAASGHLTEVREILEPGIAARAAARAADQHIAALREAVAAMDVAMDVAHRDPDAYIEADLDFHLGLAEAAENPIILTLIDSIVGLLRDQRARIFDQPGGPDRGQFHHKRILEAVVRRDPEAARHAMHAHLQQIRDDTKGTPGASPGLSPAPRN